VSLGAGFDQNDTKQRLRYTICRQSSTHRTGDNLS
jgi:hypothetical protein